MQGTITGVLKDSISEALADYHGVQTKEEDADDESDISFFRSGHTRRKKSKRENEYHVRVYKSSVILFQLMAIH